MKQSAARYCYASLEFAILIGAHREGVRLPAARLRGANLEGAHLTGSFMSLADLRGADITDLDFYLVDLRTAQLDLDQLVHMRRCGAIFGDVIA